MIRLQRKWIEYKSTNHWDGYCRKEFLYLPKTFESTKDLIIIRPRSEPIRLVSIHMAWMNETAEPVDYSIQYPNDSDLILSEALKNFEIFFPTASTILKLMMEKPLLFNLGSLNYIGHLYRRHHRKLNIEQGRSN